MSYNDEKIMRLSPANAPEMLALAQLTNSGPFAIRTIEFGHYYGIFKDGQLVAMAGQRIHPKPYVEISAVCTHPEHTGKGYARQLLSFQIKCILSNGEKPYLHVRRDNLRAIGIYESMGFAANRPLWFYIIQKPGYRSEE